MQEHNSSSASLAQRIAALPEAAKRELLLSLKPAEAEALKHEWRFWARPKQLAPDGDWRTWLLLAGRGFGKTRCLVEWANWRIETGAKLINVVGATALDVSKVLVEGPSGFLASAPPWNRPIYQPSRSRLKWQNGAVANLFSAEEPDRLRGPQCDTAIADELAAWKYPEAWDQLQFGLRLGTDPRVAVATTPRPTPLIKSLLADSTTAVTRGTTYENKANLAPQFLEAIVKRYEGTRLGRQELDGEVIDDAPGALWKRDQIELHRQPNPPQMARVVVAVDPSVSATSESAETGIVVAGLGVDGHGYLLSDESLKQPTPEQWGSQAIVAYRKFQADRIVGEVNNGGDLVESNVRAIDKSVPFKQVRASRGKAVRAEPIASFGEQGRLHHVGIFPVLEDQLCQWEPGVSTWSPNRLDALVWAFTELMLGGDLWHSPDWSYLSDLQKVAPKPFSLDAVEKW
jgi:phage terminase large subunit-like protein